MQALAKRFGAGVPFSAAASQRVTKARAKVTSFVTRPFRRQKRTLFQRCLAVHIISASETSVLR